MGKYKVRLIFYTNLEVKVQYLFLIEKLKTQINLTVSTAVDP